MFDHVVLVIIFLNCITIALERPQIEAGSTVSGWGLRAVEGMRQRDRSPGPAGGQHAGLRGLESPARPDAVEGDVAGSLPLERGPPPWTVKWQPLLGAPWLKAEADQSWETLDPWHLPVLSGTHLPHCVQLHLHSHLRGRDDTEGTWLPLGPLLPLVRGPRPWPSPAQLVTHLPLNSIPQVALEAHPHLVPAPGLGSWDWGRRDVVSFVSAAQELTTHFQCRGGTCWRCRAQGEGSI